MMVVGVRINNLQVCNFIKKSSGTLQSLLPDTENSPNLSVRPQCFTCSLHNSRSWPVFTVADLRRGVRDAPPQGSKLFQFHAVFVKIWQNRMLVPSWRVGAPTSGKSWMRHWFRNFQLSEKCSFNVLSFYYFISSSCSLFFEY